MEKKEMSDKFNFIYNTVTENMLKLDGKKITVEHAKAFASLTLMIIQVIMNYSFRMECKAKRGKQK